MTIFALQAVTVGATAASTLECGKTIKCMDMESFVGPMVSATRVTMLKTKSMDLARSFGKYYFLCMNYNSESRPNGH